MILIMKLQTHTQAAVSRLTLSEKDRTHIVSSVVACNLISIALHV